LLPADRTLQNIFLVESRHHDFVAQVTSKPVSADSARARLINSVASPRQCLSLIPYFFSNRSPMAFEELMVIAP
jgi:hypothetical protein